MDNLTVDFLSFFLPYMGLIILSSLVLSLAMSEHHILAARYYYARKWERLVGEAIREKNEAKLEVERLTKKVATLEEELSALRANSSKQK
nr:MAG TPA: Cytochrome c oxidase assembly protein [Caudoviricetes sp.]